ncbi:hypothetical protein K6119_11755 [Paracrocinitomix mangrovi]|uniref:hypothetical protein n=1 Tax=Paracrocinitomix mangrovi TaxID=2862509 RepID=UPI001C8E12BD|nr:hypothetical protein [Paracrocinitomix mangrovi]UKN00409.1 hypothetical protein K6119_11755 [Paracrocinitomix mangrovi]
MKKLLLFSFLYLAFVGFSQNRIDFGVEAQINQNRVKKWDIGAVYTDDGKSLSVLDIYGDTMDVYFNEFSMENNFEIPIYFRINRRRHFFDFKLSNSFNTLKMDGIANYNESFYTQYYGSYSDFEAQAIADGFTNVDTADYNNYIETAKQNFESNISYTQRFQLLALTVNYGYRFLPHKSIKPFLSTGFTFKGKYRKESYDYLDFSNRFIRDESAINHAINDFAEFSSYWNFVAGVELYRFRLSAYFQTGFQFSFPVSPYDNSKIVYLNDYTAFDQLYSFGFNVGVDLFRQDFGNKIHLDDVTKIGQEVSNIKRTKDKFDLGIRFNRRGFNDLSTFYGDSTQFLSVMKIDSGLVESGGNIYQGRNVEMIQFGDIKRIGWSSQFDIYGSYYFGKRWLLEMSIGYSSLKCDIETTELTATIATDTAGNNFYVNTASSPRLLAGAYRKGFNLFHFEPTLGFKFINRDIFDMRLLVGVGLTAMAHKFQGFVNQPPGINETSLTMDVEEAYYFTEFSDHILTYSDGPINVDLSNSPDEVTSKFSPDKNMSNWQSPDKIKFHYGTFKLGLVATIDRFSLGMSTVTSLSYMDGFMLRDFTTIFFSVGYKVWSR